MDFKELKDRSATDLQHELAEQRKHLFALRSQAVTEKLEDPSQLRKARKDIARIMTALRQHELNQQKTQAAAAPTAAAAK